MRSSKIAAILAVMAVVAIVIMQRGGMAQPASNIRIISPQNGQKLSTNFVEVRYELVNPAVAAAGTPNYQLQLDGHTPVQTTSTTHTFTGLAPGQHTVLVQLVDANGTPIAGSTNTVRFTVQPQPAPGGMAAGPQPEFIQVSQQSEQVLPGGSSALPLLSIIGFGVLLGGIVSALKTR
ncbi:MAG: hypothetical protein ACE14L_06715 [Terriglobales bacterium]